MRTALAATTMISAVIGPIVPAEAQTARTTTPITHVIVIIGENRTFDHVYGTYTPKSGETVNNLLSQGIVRADGTPGPNFHKALQNAAQDTGTYTNAPATKTPYATLPPPLTDGAPQKAADTNPPPFATVAAVTAIEAVINDGLPTADYNL